MRILVDCLEFASPCADETDVFYFLGLQNINFVRMRSFVQNYDYGFFYEGIKIAFGTGQYKSYVSISGKGCRVLEDLKGKSFDWLEFLKQIVNDFDPSFRRIDIACDIDDDLVTPEKCIKYYAKHQFAGLARHVEGYIFDRNEFQVGSVKSNVLVRIYDKALERGYKDSLIDGHRWTRVEMQLRAAASQQFIFEFLQGKDLFKYFSGHLMSFCRFTTKPNDKKNSQRLPTAPWWLKFCNDAEKICFVSHPGSDYNLNKLNRYLNDYAARSIKTMLYLQGTDNFVKHFTDSKIKFTQDQTYLLKNARVDLTADYDLINDLKDENSMIWNECVLEGLPWEES